MDKAMLADKLKAIMDLKEQLEKLALEEGSESSEDEMMESPDKQVMEEKLGIEKHPEMAEEVVEEEPDFQSKFQDFMDGKGRTEVAEGDEAKPRKGIMMALMAKKSAAPMGMMKKKK